jgi:hypothetical protein
MARDAATSQARLIHYELAGRYSIKAAHCLPFLVAARTEPATEAERLALQLPERRDPRVPGGERR